MDDGHDSEARGTAGSGKAGIGFQSCEYRVAQSLRFAGPSAGGHPPFPTPLREKTADDIGAKVMVVLTAAGPRIRLG